MSKALLLMLRCFVIYSKHRNRPYTWIEIKQEHVQSMSCKSAVEFSARNSKKCLMILIAVVLWQLF